MPSDPRDTVKKLIAAVVHENTDRNEAAEKAIAACRLISEHELLDVKQKRVADISPDEVVDFVKTGASVLDAIFGREGREAEPRRRRAGAMRGSGRRSGRY